VPPALDDEVDPAHVVLHRAETPRGAVRSPWRRAPANVCPLLRAARRERESGAFDRRVELHHVDAALREHEARRDIGPPGEHVRFGEPDRDVVERFRVTRKSGHSAGFGKRPGATVGAPRRPAASASMTI